jgi:aminoglycoside phosphotransferase (APT) family kinase protein
LGIPAEAAYIDAYCRRTGRDSAAARAVLAQDWNFYLAYNLFRMAAILQGIAKRVDSGTAASEQARQAGSGARPLAELGWEFAQRA